MKLRNKQTPTKLAKIVPYDNEGNVGIAVETDQGVVWYYHSLAELNEEWEDYEESKEYWFISDRCRVFHTEDTSFIGKERKSFGNYFDTREEAEQAVEKLKAVKRLKDGGLEIIKYETDGGIDKNDMFIGEIRLILSSSKRIDYKLLDLLFGGEE